MGLRVKAKRLIRFREVDGHIYMVKNDALYGKGSVGPLSICLGFPLAGAHSLYLKDHNFFYFGPRALQ